MPSTLSKISGANARFYRQHREPRVPRIAAAHADVYKTDRMQAFIEVVAREFEQAF